MTPKRIILLVVVVIVAIVIIVNVTKKTEPGSTVQGGAGTGNSGTIANASNTGNAGSSGNSGVTSTSYPKGETGNQDFAVASLQEKEQFDNEIGGSIRITNVGTQTYDVSFTVTFFPTAAETGNPLGSATGSALSVTPGETVTEDLLSTDAQFSNANFYYQFQVNFETAVG